MCRLGVILDFSSLVSFVGMYIEIDLEHCMCTLCFCNLRLAVVNTICWNACPVSQQLCLNQSFQRGFGIVWVVFNVSIGTASSQMVVVFVAG